MEKLKEMCDQIGYGHVMHLVSSMWLQKMKDRDIPTSGVFIPVLPFQIKDQERDNIINEVLKYKPQNP